MEAEFQDYERNRKWTEIYNNIYLMAERFPSKESSKIENKPLNRYLDVVPYDKTRVKLERNNLNYINASHVCVPSANRKYILTQGPLESTSGHFWLMIWEQNSKAILMLNNLIERGHVKCHQYWPNGKENDDEDEFLFEDVHLKVELVSAREFDSYKLRTIRLTDLVSENSREVLHFHYTHWPDFDLPKSSDSFLEFLDAVRKSKCLDIDLNGPPVIHCSAGIGRSGTFVLVDSCLVMIERNQCRDSINVIDVLLEMRKFRMGLIQTPGQLRFSFQTILEGSKKILGQEHSNTRKAILSSKISRSLGVNEEEEEEEENEEVDEETRFDTTLDDSNTQEDAENEINLRQRKRDEKRQNTMDTINRIKRKQKEVEERYPKKRRS